MGVRIKQILENAHASDWNCFRSSSVELLQLLPFLSTEAGANEQHYSQERVLRSRDKQLLCVVEESEGRNSALMHDAPVLTIAYTQSLSAMSEAFADTAQYQTLDASSTLLFGLLESAYQVSQLKVANRILSAFKFEERTELEYEFWLRGFMEALGTIVQADQIQIRLRTSSDFWEAHGDDWTWPPNNANGSAMALDIRTFSDLSRSGVISHVVIEINEKIEPNCTIHFPLKGRQHSIGVLSLSFQRELNVIPEEMKLLDLLQREVTSYLDRTRNHLRMQRMATFDGLTNLYNHRFFRIQLRTEFQRALRYQKKLTLIMIDIDDFKGYNDRHGHLSGDRVLTEIAKTIRSTVRDIDFVARYGGEEFALILPEVDSSGGMIVAEKVRAAISAQHFRNDGGADLGSITVSCGVTDNVDTVGPNDLIRRADRALYWVKTHGRNLVRRADSVEEA